MLLKYFCFDCDTAVEGDYVINITKDSCGGCSAKLKLLTTAPAVPNPPTSGYVTDSNGGAYDCGNPILGWTASTTSGVTYTISEGATTIATGVTGTTYTILGATAGNHTYTITAVNSGGTSTPLNIIVLVSVCLTAPMNVTNLTVTDSGGGAYDCGNPILNWTASSGATSYDIFEGATLLGNVVGTTYTVSGASIGSHTYTVVAKNGAGSASGVSITVTVVACLSAPGNVTGTINVYDSGTSTNYTCGTSFDVDFTDVATATYYQLFEGATQIGSNSPTSNFVVTGQSIGSHTYTIKACNGAGCSTGTNFSVTVSACLVGSCRSGVGFPTNSGFVWNDATASTAMGLSAPGFTFVPTTDTAAAGTYNVTYNLHFQGPAFGNFTFDIVETYNSGSFTSLYSASLVFDGTGNYIGTHTVTGANLINNIAIMGQYASSGGAITPVTGTCFTFN